MGANSPLFLASIDGSSIQSDSKQRLWALIVELSVRLERANQFSIEAVTQTSGRRRHHADHAPQLGALLGTEGSVGGRLRPALGVLPSIIDTGLKVLSINLYSNGAWVAGASDWGDSLSVLFDDEAWPELRAEMEQMTPPPRFELAEAEERPIEQS